MDRVADPTLAARILEAAEGCVRPANPAAREPDGPRPAVSVAIPVLDGGERLLELVDAIAAQRLDGAVEVLLADSGSTDGAPARAAERLPGLRLFRVPPGAFDHGLVRTGLVLRARAALVALFSQDAVPRGPDCLARLAAAFDAEPVVGATARQVPRPGAPPEVARRLARWTPPPEETPPELRRRRLADPAAWAALPLPQRLRLALHDHVAAMVRRDAVLALPFPPRDFGEDLAWATAALQAGGALAYVPEAIVEHHHDPAPRERYERNRVAHRQASAELGLRTVRGPLQLAGALAAGTVAESATSGAARALGTLPWRAGELLGQWRGGLEGERLGATGPALRLGGPPAAPPRIGAVITALAGSPHLDEAVRSLRADGAERVFVACDGPVAEAEGLRAVRVAPGTSFAARAEAGLDAAAQAGCTLLAVFNDDVSVEPGTLAALADALRDPRVGLAGAVLLDWDGGGVQSAGIRVGRRTGRTRVLDALPAEVETRDAVGGAALMLRADDRAALGGFDPDFTHFFEDVELCLRFGRAGLRTVVVPAARVRHRGGGSLERRDPRTARLLGRNHLRLARRLPGGPVERALRPPLLSAAGLVWTLRSVGPAGLPAFLAGLREGLGDP